MKEGKMKKILAAVCLSATALTLVPTASMAEAAVIPVTSQHEEGIAPYLMYIADSRAELSISGKTASVSCWVKGDSSYATKAKVVAELQEKRGSSWTTIATWNDTQNSYRASVSKTRSVTTGKTYRVKATVTAWQGAQSETKTVYSDEKKA